VAAPRAAPKGDTEACSGYRLIGEVHLFGVSTTLDQIMLMGRLVHALGIDDQPIGPGARVQC